MSIKPTAPAPMSPVLEKVSAVSALPTTWNLMNSPPAYSLLRWRRPTTAPLPNLPRSLLIKLIVVGKTDLRYIVVNDE